MCITSGGEDTNILLVVEDQGVITEDNTRTQTNEEMRDLNVRDRTSKPE